MPKVLTDINERLRVEEAILDWPEDYIRTVDLVKIFGVSRRRINIAMIELESTSPHEQLKAFLMADQIFGSVDSDG